MLKIEQQKRSDGTSLFKIVDENGKTKKAFVADPKTDKEVEKWQAELNGETPKRKKK